FERLPVAAQRLAGEVAEDARRAQHLAGALGAGLAFLAGEQLAELGRARKNQGGDLVEHVGAHLGRGLRPVGAGVGRGGHRAVHIGRAAIGKARDDVVGVRGVAAFERVVGAGPFAADVVTQGTRIHVVCQLLSMRPRAARLRMNAAMPSSHGGASREVVTVFVRRPSLCELIVTRSPSLCVKPAPGVSRSCVGANSVPQNSTKPSGKGCSLSVWRTRSSGSRLIWPMPLEPSSRSPSAPSLSRSTLAPRTSSMVKCSSNRRIIGPSAQLALLSLALLSSSAERPSKSRRLTSLPSIAPTVSPRGSTASTISGSGLFQVESERTPI